MALQSQGNGWYSDKVKNYGTYNVYIPPNANSSTKVYFFSCNPSTQKADWENIIKGKMDENAIYFFIPSLQDSDYQATTVSNYITDQLLGITQKYNIPTENIDMFCWSNGSKGASSVATKLNAKGYTIGKFISFYGNFDGFQNRNFFSNFEVGKSSTFPFIYIDDGSNHVSYSGASTTYDTFKKKCNDYIVIKIKNPDSHGFKSADDKYNLINFFIKGEDLAKECEIIHYVNGQPTKLSYKEFEELMHTASIETLKENNAELSDFAKFFEGGPGDTLASNLAYVSNAMSAINSQITEHTDVNYESPAGEAKVIGTMYKASNYYGAVTNVLYGNLSAETEAVYAIANAIYKMDDCASMIAETTLSDGMRGLFSSSHPSVSTALDELASKSAELFDTAKTAVTAGGRYDELRGILSDKPDAGSIGKVSVSSLESAINAIVPNLENEVNKATGIKSSVEEFISGIGTSNILQGETWNAVKTNMENYSSLLDCNAKAATFISDTIKTAMGLVVDYIQNASSSIKAVDATEFGNLAALDELDDSKLGELNQAIQTMTDRITEQEEFIKEKEALPDVCDSCLGADGETYEPCNCRRPYSAADMQGWKDTLQKYIDIKTDLNTYKGVLEGFAPVVAQAQDIINDAIDQVKTAYENPTTDTKGNQTFNSDFSLDLSKYGIDDSKDYKKLIDDYYAKLNPPKATLDDVLNLDEQEPDPAGSNPDSPSSPGGPSGPGVTPPDPTTPTTQAPTEALTEAPTSTSTEPETTPVTEPETVPQTEPDTVPKTIPATEPKTDVVVEPETQVPTEPSEQEPTQKQPSGGGTSKKPKNPNVDPLEKPSEPEIVEDIIPEEPIVDEPIVSDYIEPAIEAPIEEAPVEIEPVPTETKNTSGLKAMGIASGIGLAVGGAALGAHSIMKSKDDEDTDEDYGYDK